MQSELENYREHAERYRAVTLQTLDVLASDTELAWRPTPESMSCGQQLVHIAKTEDYYARGLFTGVWDPSLLRVDRPLRTRDAIRAYFTEVRERTRGHLDGVSESALGTICPDVPGGLNPATLRWWLWFLLEHEMHHKGQVALYLRLMGHMAPFYAMPLPLGQRPDIGVRAALGGV